MSTRITYKTLKDDDEWGIPVYINVCIYITKFYIILLLLQDNNNNLCSVHICLERIHHALVSLRIGNLRNNLVNKLKRISNRFSFFCRDSKLIKTTPLHVLQG